MQKLSANTKSTTAVHILARVQFKSDPRKVIYSVLSSDGISQYQVFFFDGKPCSCSCPSTRSCYHLTQLSIKEQARQEELAREIDRGLSSRVNTEELAAIETRNSYARYSYCQYDIA